MSDKINFNAQDWIEAVREAVEMENNADEYYAGDKTALSGRHWVGYYNGNKEYPYSDVEGEFWEWCLNNLPEDSEAARVWNSTSEVCDEDYEAIGEWALDMLFDWYYRDDEERTDAEYEVKDVLTDIAHKWKTMILY